MFMAAVCKLLHFSKASLFRLSSGESSKKLTSHIPVFLTNLSVKYKEVQWEDSIEMCSQVAHSVS